MLYSCYREGAYGSGLSVSHDSVFTGERSGDESSDERPTPAHGLAHVATSHRVSTRYELIKNNDKTVYTYDPYRKSGSIINRNRTISSSLDFTAGL